MNFYEGKPNAVIGYQILVRHFYYQLGRTFYDLLT